LKNLLKTLATLLVLRKVFASEHMSDFVKTVDEGAISLVYQNDQNLTAALSSNRVPDDDPEFVSLYLTCTARHGQNNGETCARVVRYWLSRVHPQTSKTGALTFLGNPVLAGLKSIQSLNTRGEK